MDGLQVIADAVYHALKGGTRIADVFAMVSAIADAGTAALVMTYWNPVDRYGVDAFARDLANVRMGPYLPDHPGPDCTPEEAGFWLCRLRRSPALTASSWSRRPPRRPGSSRSVSSAGGFVYAVSLMGITGTKARPVEARSRMGIGGADLASTRDLPVASRPRRSNTRDQAAEVAAFLAGRRDRRLRLRPPPRPGAAWPSRRGRPPVRALTADLAEGVPPRAAGRGPSREPKGLRRPGGEWESRAPGGEWDNEYSVPPFEPGAVALASRADPVPGAGTGDRAWHHRRHRHRRLRSYRNAGGPRGVITDIAALRPSRSA